MPGNTEVIARFVSDLKYEDIPREVVERTSWIPGTRRIASSRTRVTVGIMCAAGSSPASAMSLTIGNVTDGKIAEGSRAVS